jgi:hypothetical protein
MRRVFVAAVVLVAVVLVVRAWAAAPVKAFQGYWMGVDPVDGGDSRRGFLQLADGTFALAGRDSFLRLCDETDRGIVTFEDGTVVGHRVMTSDTVKDLSRQMISTARSQCVATHPDKLEFACYLVSQEELVPGA